MEFADSRTQTWRISEGTPSLGPRQVHLWRVHLDAPAEQAEWLALSLSAAERARSASCERDKVRLAVGRGALRHVLAGYLAAEPRELVFAYGHRGKPALAGPWASQLYFNVSHSSGIAMYAVSSTRPLGIDVEYQRHVPDMLRIAERNFSASEAAALRAAPPDRACEAFFRCWTRKEAYVKALGDGLAMPLDSFEVSVADHEPAALRSIAGSPAAAENWEIRDLAPAPGYAAAVAFERGGNEITCSSFEFSP